MRRNQRAAALARRRQADLLANVMERRRIRKIKDDITAFFTREYNFKYLRPVGGTEGNHGGTGLFSEFDPNTSVEKRKLIVKYSLGILPNKEDSDAHLRNEVKWLGYFGGSEHFIEALNVRPNNATSDSGSDGKDDGKTADPAAKNDPVDDSLITDISIMTLGDDKDDGEGKDISMEGAGGQDDSDSGSGSALQIPAFILEYLPLGDLDHLRERMVRKGGRVPSRLLWQMMLCMVRMCIGLAYYEDMKNGKRERIPPGKNPSTLEHNSLKPPNMLLADLVPGDNEHGQNPLLKLIDFGRTDFSQDPASAHYPDGPGVQWNLFYMAAVLETLACIQTDLNPGCSWIPRRRIRHMFDGPSLTMMLTRAHDDWVDDRHLDPVLRNLICRCMSVTDDGYLSRCPTLKEALDICLSRHNMDAETMFPFPSGVPGWETDEAVDQYIVETVLGVPDSSDPPPAGP
ncbi:hypothetical protein JX265_004218 [Neoarthrinium moseri]|uniref:Protein kinase domain-containing protein n=1 Tax=Neoarthrinium moseri TaxID=1658444 RepID=A0A9Q0AR11_9PEZI|nr:hypothetical protein JX266_005983 [Neoarthrinium moseri]KAI1875160.1 hypothetical protein JX265_004218 [Neoarthrinium moseri]